MALLKRTAASLRILGDELDPSEITRLIGKQPTKARKKGDLFKTPNGKSIAAQTGIWIIKTEDKIPGDIDSQVIEILGGTTDDAETWIGLSKQYKVEIFAGLFLEDQNEGLTVSSDTMMLLGSRGIGLDFDIYNVN